MKPPRLTPAMRQRLHARMVGMDALWHLALFGVLSGLLAGLVIVAFRLLIESVQMSFLADSNPENYEALAWWWRLLLPIGGGLLIGLVFQATQAQSRSVGVVHVMERLAYHQANLPLSNAIMQFFGAAVAIISGHSVGREGPAVHLGATAGSRLAQGLHLSNSSSRTLVACGVAAAIAASFNTPLAGVVFAMEVVLMEYVLASFIPVILAAVAATIVSRIFFGDAPAFDVPPMQLGSMQEIPYVLLLGLVVGCIAALFYYCLRYFSAVAKGRPLWQRTTLAGLLVGVCAVFVPAIMGIGYDTVNGAMLGQLGIGLLLLIVLVKVVATSAALGLGVPGGLIGPTLMIGACAGAALGALAAMLSPDVTSSAGHYAMIGMGAMMGATLQAPLAALIALLELTANPHIILPGMLAIVSASLVSSQVFGTRSIFMMLGEMRGLNYQDSPVAQALRRISVMKGMDREVVHCSRQLGAAEADEILRRQPHWLVFDCDKERAQVLAPADLARRLEAADGEGLIDLAAIPAQRAEALAIDMRASLQEALQLLRERQAEMLYVVNRADPDCCAVLGVLTEEDIEEHYRYPATNA